MNKQEFNDFWNKCIMPTYKELHNKDSDLYIRDGSADSLCRNYNDIKNSTKRLYMKKSDETIKLDRHKIASCMAKAIMLDKPVCKKLGDDYTGTEDELVIANAVLAFSASISIMKAYVELSLAKENLQFREHEAEYRKICENGFVFPKTIMEVDYMSSVCWAWHHNAISGHFDVLGTANLLFMIENYSLEFYSK